MAKLNCSIPHEAEGMSFDQTIITNSFLIGRGDTLFEQSPIDPKAFRIQMNMMLLAPLELMVPSNPDRQQTLDQVEQFYAQNVERMNVEGQIATAVARWRK